MIFRRRAAATAVLQLAFLLLVALGLPALVLRSRGLERWLHVKDLPQKRVMPASPGIQSAEDGQRRLRETQPEWVLIGNSMLNSRIEPKFFGNLTQQRFYKLSISGTKSPMWYLMFKRMVVASGVKPKCVTLFFKELDWTWPELRMARNEEMIERMKGREQPEWPEVMQRYDSAVAMTWYGMTTLTGKRLDVLLPADKLREWARWKMKKTAFKFTSFGPETPNNTRLHELNDRLSMDHQRKNARGMLAGEEQDNEGQDALTSLEADFKPMTFDASRSESFLEHLIELAHTHGIKLHFHRVRRNSSLNAPENAMTPNMTDYYNALRSYLESKDCLYTDEENWSDIKDEMYLDDYHISSESQYQQPYMRTFWQQLKPTLLPLLKTQTTAESHTTEP
jgi:hypothetical protein